MGQCRGGGQANISICWWHISDTMFRRLGGQLWNGVGTGAGQHLGAVRIPHRIRRRQASRLSGTFFGRCGKLVLQSATGRI